MSVYLKDEYIKQAEDLVARTASNGGLAPVDIERFWEDDAKAHADPWSDSCPQVPLGISMGGECVFAELGVEEDWYSLVHDSEYRVRHSRSYNDLAEQIVGKRLLNEKSPDPTMAWPEIKALHDIFEARNKWEDMSYWLMQSADTPDELDALLDRVESRLENLREFMLPGNWAAEKDRILAAGGSIPLYRGQRGPITFAMSVYGVENLIFLLMDQPALASRFSEVILRAMLARGKVLDEEAGYVDEKAPGGFYWCDDNCAMLNVEMYESFGFPVLKGIFDHYCAEPSDRRGQHSDSDMAHLLPILGRFDLGSVNLGPNVKALEIREHMPHTAICGQLAPFTFSRNEEVNIVAEFLRDLEMVRDTKGLIFSTAGSINNGSKLSSMRLIMAAIQEFGQY